MRNDVLALLASAATIPLLLVAGWPLWSGGADSRATDLTRRALLVAMVGTAAIGGDGLLISLPYWALETPPETGEGALFPWFTLTTGLLWAHAGATLAAVDWLRSRRTPRLWPWAVATLVAVPLVVLLTLFAPVRSRPETRPADAGGIPLVLLPATRIPLCAALPPGDTNHRR